MAGLFSAPRALEDAVIRLLIERFANAAVQAEAAGFAGVQIHAAHGYLISQFLSPLSNVREDEWGGTPQNRMRFLLEIVRASLGATSTGFGVAVKLNSADFQRGGFTLEESMDVAQALDAEGIDYLEISGGNYERPAMVGSDAVERASTRAREAFFLEYAERMREVVELPIMLTGGLRSASAMVEAIESGAVDIIGLARPIDEPRWDNHREPRRGVQQSNPHCLPPRCEPKAHRARLASGPDKDGLKPIPTWKSKRSRMY
jgi:2,4-dienoyl-CoA reductase-like NADH-dependent reductase (Old Yellow Enzyme family)